MESNIGRLLRQHTPGDGVRVNRSTFNLPSTGPPSWDEYEYQLHESRVRHREQQSEVLFSHSGKYSRAWRDLRLVADCGLKSYEPIVQPLLDDCDRLVTIRRSCPS